MLPRKTGKSVKTVSYNYHIAKCNNFCEHCVCVCVFMCIYTGQVDYLWNMSTAGSSWATEHMLPVDQEQDFMVKLMALKSLYNKILRIFIFKKLYAYPCHARSYWNCPPSFSPHFWHLLRKLLFTFLSSFWEIELISCGKFKQNLMRVITNNIWLFRFLNLAPYYYLWEQ